MEAQSYTAEQRRAANQVWAAAGAYGFEPLFLAHNTDGTIDFYMNCVVGLVHKYYGDDLLRDLFATWDGDLRESQLDDLPSPLRRPVRRGIGPRAGKTRCASSASVSVMAAASRMYRSAAMRCPSLRRNAGWSIL